MKRVKLYGLLILVVGVVVTGLTSFKHNSGVGDKQNQQEIDFDAPDKVYNILENSCFDCHLKNSKNEKAKKKLVFDNFNRLSPMSQAAKRTEIAKILKEGKMPPKKYLDNFPEKKLTQEEMNTVTKWASERAGLGVK